jgi:ketosteroid isomerase-like protein
MGTNVDAVGRVYEAFARGDIPTVIGAMDDKIDWQEPASVPFENQIGPEAVAENIFMPLAEQVEGFTVTPNEIVDGGDIVCTIGVYAGKGATTAIEFTADFVHVWRFGPTGKITGFRTYTDTHIWREVLGVH